MKHGDRVAMTLHNGFDDEDVMCVVTELPSGNLALTDEDGVVIATVRQFWRKESDASLTGKSPTAKAVCSAPRKIGTEMKCCEAPGCGSVYKVKRSDLARGWGKTCSKSCAAKLREHKKAISNG